MHATVMMYNEDGWFLSMCGVGLRQAMQLSMTVGSQQHHLVTLDTQEVVTA